MNHRRLWVAATIIALVIIIGFVFSVPHNRDVLETQTPDIASANVPLVTVRDVFKKGTHTITGSVEVPNVCTTVSARAATSTEGILIELSVLSDRGMCLQLPILAPFEITLSAPEDLPLTVTVNGSLASTSAP